MEMEERDFVTFTDDDGKEFELDVVDYFEYEGEEYAVLMDMSDECEDEESACTCADEECACTCADEEDESSRDIYIMKIVVDGDEENFVPADEDKFDVLSAIVEERLSGACSCGCCDDECGCGDDECDCGNDCDCEDDACDCGDDHCGCGCEHNK